MTKEKFEYLMYKINKTPLFKMAVIFSAKWLPFCMAAVYAAAGLLLIIRQNMLIVQYLAVPAATFFLTTAVRKIINRQRPYDALDYVPLMPYKKDKGKSFPSRHAACAWIIAFACFFAYEPVGILMAAGALAVSAARVFSGLHYPSDVTAGAVFAGLCAAIGFVFI